VLALPQFIVRAHAGRLSRELSRASVNPVQQPKRVWEWRRGALRLPGAGELAVVSDPHGDLDLRRLPARVAVRFFAASPQLQGRSLRKLFQELQVPSWERERLPLLGPVRGGGFEDLLAIGDLWLHERIRSGPKNSRRGRIVWRAQS
jgi:tRNA(Ile)-lysidine synthetase-like protein